MYRVLSTDGAYGRHNAQESAAAAARS